MIQPSRGTDLWTVEARDASGALRFDCAQPPRAMLRISLDGLYAAMFRDDPRAIGQWSDLTAWLGGHGWTARRVYW